MQGEKHVIVNNGILEVLQLNYPDENILIIADTKHYNSLSKKNKFNKNTSCYKVFEYNSKEIRKVFIIKKICREVSLAFSLFRKAKKEQARFILFASAFPFVAPFINFFSKVYKQKIIICQHGELGVLQIKKDQLTTKIFRYIIKYVQKNRNIKYNTSLFYGKSIRDNLFSKYKQFPTENTIVIDHPYEYEQRHKPIESTSSKLRITSIGTAILAKNSQYFFELARKASDLIQNQTVEFIQIGKIESEILPYVNPFVNILLSGTEFIPLDVFEKAQLEADYYIYFFDKGGYYDLCPSGTFFDAVKNLTPIISLRNDFFEYYFEKLGNIGYLCNSVDEMLLLLNDLVNGRKKTDYDEQVDNLSKGQYLLSTTKIAATFKVQMQENGFG